MTRKKKPPLTSDVYGPPDTRCPDCKQFVTEGSEHDCPLGNTQRQWDGTHNPDRK